MKIKCNFEMKTKGNGGENIFVFFFVRLKMLKERVRERDRIQNIEKFCSR